MDFAKAMRQVVGGKTVRHKVDEEFTYMRRNKLGKGDLEVGVGDPDDLYWGKPEEIYADELDATDWVVVEEDGL